MDRVKSWAASEEVESADLNGIQDQAAALYEVAWTWRGRRPSLRCDGSNLYVGAHRGCAIGASQASTLFVPGDGGTTMPLSGLTPSTWYYLYAYEDDPSCAYEWSTTAPDASLSHKSDDEELAYVGCFYASGASAARPFRMTNGQYVYDHSSIASCLALSGGAAVSFTDVDLTALLPPHARMALLYALVTSSSTTDGARVRPNGSSNTGTPIYQYATTLWCETDAGQLIEYQKDAANTVSLYVLGFRE